jgi:hypothetical protein
MTEFIEAGPPWAGGGVNGTRLVVIGPLQMLEYMPMITVTH